MTIEATIQDAVTKAVQPLVDKLTAIEPVSYTHLTLPTNREV